MKRNFLGIVVVNILILVFSSHLSADGNRIICTKVDKKSVLESSKISQSADLDKFEILISCSLIGSRESENKYYGVVSKMEESDACLHEVTSINDPLKNVFGESEPEKKYYAMLSSKNSCPGFSTKQYTRMPLGMNKYESIRYSESINRFFKKASKSKSEFKSAFKSIGFLSKLINNFSAFRDSFQGLIKNKDIQYTLDEVTYCYGDNQDVRSGCLAVRITVGGEDSWVIEFDSSGVELAPTKVYEVI